MTRTLLEKCEIPISSEEKTLLQLAASMAGLSLSAFIRKVAISAAKDSINKNNYVLSGQEAGELFSVIDKGFVPNDACGRRHGAFCHRKSICRAARRRGHCILRDK